MELKQKLIYLNLIFKKKLTQAIHLWKLQTSLGHLKSKYQKLKSYTAKVLKYRKVPEIRILTTKNQEESRSRQSSVERTGFHSTKSGLSTKTLVYRSSSIHKNSKKPPIPTAKFSDIENISKTSTNFFSTSSKPHQKSSQTPKVLNSDEVAVVSSHLPISGLSLKKFDSNSETYFKIR
jgi:hypothetical protein